MKIIGNKSLEIVGEKNIRRNQKVDRIIKSLEILETIGVLLGFIKAMDR